MLKCANRLIRSWNGPAIIQGDFNQDISANADIAELFTGGWVDAHDISVRSHQHTKKNPHVSLPMEVFHITPKSFVTPLLPTASFTAMHGMISYLRLIQRWYPLVN